MNPEELLSLVTLGAIAPYALEAVVRNASSSFRSLIGAYAPAWLRFQKCGTHSVCPPAYPPIRTIFSFFSPKR